MTKRPIKITVRLSQTEAARLDALASECGSKKEPLIRRLIMGVEIKGPVDKCQKTAETRSGPGRIGNMQIEKDGACHPFKV